MPRTICYITGTRADFGLMRSTLDAIRSHPALRLQLIATGMHLDPRHGRTLTTLKHEGFPPNALVPWPSNSGRSPATLANATGNAIAALSRAFHRLKTDIVLVLGDRAEAFAAAAAAHLSHIPLAHIHGGDQALGQVDDALRHAITKLAHIHFPATKQSALRIQRLGEEPRRIHCAGAPGLDGITSQAAPWDQVSALSPNLRPRSYALLVLHPADPNPDLEYRRAKLVLNGVRKAGFDQVAIVYPNNDPGCSGIIRCWQEQSQSPDLLIWRNLDRPLFLGLMANAAALVGNSSSGIIEAASFSLPVLDIGPRQTGRERSRNVAHCEYSAPRITQILHRLWNAGRPRRFRCPNVYGGNGTGRRIADILARLDIGEPLLHKLITY